MSTEQPQHTRHTLLQKLQSSAGDENNWDEFVSYYEGYIYVIIRNFKIDIEDSEDLLQEVLIKVWKSLPSYNYDKDKCRFEVLRCRSKITIIKAHQSVAQERKKRNDQMRAHLNGDISRI